jgi:hypothetical protein
MAHWPEQTYQVQSRVDFPRMTQLFFKDEKWTVTGDGDFKGIFHLSKDRTGSRRRVHQRCSPA